MRKILSNVLLFPYFIASLFRKANPLSFFRKSRIDNFIGGVVFGALFSLLVNIITVKVQEDIGKQRVLEAVEREIVFHALMANDFVNTVNRISEMGDEEYLVVDNNLSWRYPTRVWMSENTPAYIFELDPKSAAELETYYSYIVGNANRILEENQKDFGDIYKRCVPLYKLISGEEREDKLVCNAMARGAISLAATSFPGMIIEDVEEIRESFHPTQDRLDSWWLSLLLGNKAYPVMKLENQP